MSTDLANISVVIPTHNRSTLLRRALQSIREQTHPAAEIIVVDDGSEDDTADTVAREFPEARYLQQPNRGVSAARNTGIRAARGDWIALLDSDDEWLPEKLERQVALLEGDRAAVLCHCDEIWIRNGRRVNPRRRHRKSGGWIFQRCLPLCVVSPSAAVIRHSLFNEVGLFDESLPACEDYDMWLRVCSRYAVHYVDEPLVVKYGGHADQLSRRFPGMDRWRILALEKIIRAGVLTSDDRAAATRTLLKKIDVYRQGVVKRGRYEEARALDAKRAAFEREG